MYMVSAVLVIALIGLFALTLRALAQDRRVLRRTTDFVNNMVHEFRTPLTNISLATTMITRSEANAEKRNHFAGIIRDESEKLKLQVDRLLQLASEKDDLASVKREIDVDEIISEQVHSFEMQVSNAGGHITFETSAKNSSIHGDSLMISAAIRNLLDNALKYSGQSPAIMITSRNEGKNLVIAVADSGIGIKQEDQKFIFDKFYRVPNGDVHDVKGFGIGLSFVKKVMETHKGSVTVKSEPGKGSTFTLTFPVE
jgi:two-component system, OmpR family, phosphate regulon sensor histidine kinase PhoR